MSDRPRIEDVEVPASASAGEVATVNGTGDGLEYVAPAGGAPSGAAGGDLAGTYPNPTIGSAGFEAIRDMLSTALVAGSGITITPDDVGDEIEIAATGGASAHVVEDEGTPLTARANLNFTGAGVTVTDDGVDTTIVTIPGGAAGIPAQSLIHVSCFIAKPTSTVGAWTRGLTGSNGSYILSSGAQNDEAVWWIPLGPGTYDLTLAFQTSIQTAIATIDVDDGAGSYTNLTTIDTYLGGTSDKQTVVTGLTVAGSATRRRVRLKAATKNASSANYYLSLHGFVFDRTA